MKNMIRALGLLGLSLLVSCADQDRSITPTATKTVHTHTVLKSVDVGGQTVALYRDDANGSAVMGLVIQGEDGAPRFFPAFASTFKGLPPGKFNIYASKARDELWVKSSWKNHHILIYYRLGADSAITQFGDQPALDQPTPTMLVGGAAEFPEMDAAGVTEIATVQMN